MFTMPECRVSASNSAILSSENFLIPITLRCEARNMQSALDNLHRSFQEIQSFIPRLSNTVAGVNLIDFDEAISPRLSRVDIMLHGKDYRFDLTFGVKCPIPKEHDFWARIQFITLVYDKLSELVAVFEDRKGIDLFLEEARLSQQKDDTDKMRMFRK